MCVSGWMEGGGMGGGKRMKPAPLKISRESRMMRKAPAPIPVVPQRQPVIIHTYSPKVIETDAHHFMWLVQRLTGCSDTILRCKNNKPANLPASMPSSPRERGVSGARRSSKVLKRSQEFNEEEEHEHKKRIKMVIQSNQANNHDSEEDTQACVEEIQHQFGPAVFKVEQLLLSPTSSSDSGLCFNSTRRVCAPLVASPKSPLVSFDASAFQFLHGSHPFATSSALATNTDALNPQSATFSWSPTLTTNELMSDFPLSDLWAAPTEPHGLSPYSRLLGSIQSPAMASIFDSLKDASNMP